MKILSNTIISLDNFFFSACCVQLLEAVKLRCAEGIMLKATTY